MNFKHRFLNILFLSILDCSIIFAQTESKLNYETLFYTELAISNITDDLNYRRELEKTIREINQFTLSDSLWKMWQAIIDSQFVVPQKDSISALRKLASGSQKAKQAVEMLHLLDDNQSDSLEENRIKLNSILELEKARVDLEESIKLNPYDHRTQKWLVWVFQRLADMHAERENYNRSTTMLEYLAYILKDDPQLYYKLGENYMWLSNWKKARENIQKSINLILDSDWESINTDELFYHYSLRAETEIKLKLVSEALVTLNYAKLIAPTPEEEQKIQWKINWINWDEGNISNSIKYDRLKDKFKNYKDYRQLKSDYLKLLNQLTSTKAKDEIQWQIAKLEFQYLKEKNQAIDRLFRVIKRIAIDSVGMAIESEYQKYLYDYGLMCYNLGVEYLRKNNYKLSYIYFTQSIAIHWNGIGKSYLQLAYLSSMNNDVAIEFCNRTLLYKNLLSLSEIHKTYQLLFNSFKRKGEFEEAELWYRKLVNMQL